MENQKLHQNTFNFIRSEKRERIPNSYEKLVRAKFVGLFYTPW
jgi:hypothetical protein